MPNGASISHPPLPYYNIPRRQQMVSALGIEPGSSASIITVITGEGGHVDSTPFRSVSTSHACHRGVMGIRWRRVACGSCPQDPAPPLAQPSQTTIAAPWNWNPSWDKRPKFGGCQTDSSASLPYSSPYYSPSNTKPSSPSDSYSSKSGSQYRTSSSYSSSYSPSGSSSPSYSQSSGYSASSPSYTSGSNPSWTWPSWPSAAFSTSSRSYGDQDIFYGGWKSGWSESGSWSTGEPETVPAPLFGSCVVDWSIAALSNKSALVCGIVQAFLDGQAKFCCLPQYLPCLKERQQSR